MSEELLKCAKCGKDKPASKMHLYEGNRYCCVVCCGDPKKDDHKQRVKEACEFC